jgi:hypothetical protein
MKGLRKKAMWAKKRAANAEAKAAAKLENTVKRFKKPKFTELRQRESRVVITEAMQRTADLPSASCRVAVTRTGSRPEPSMTPEEYAIREAAAQLEIKRKKTQVAPMWNKGGYQYVGDAPPEIIRNLGKKV